jgi:hypothetical protein
MTIQKRTGTDAAMSIIAAFNMSIKKISSLTNFLKAFPFLIMSFSIKYIYYPSMISFQFDKAI